MFSSSSIARLSASLGDQGLFSSTNVLQIADVVPPPSSCIFPVLAMFLAHSSPISSWRDE